MQTLMEQVWNGTSEPAFLTLLNKAAAAAAGLGTTLGGRKVLHSCLEVPVSFAHVHNDS